MQIKIFTINIEAPSEDTEVLNKFLRSNRVLSVQQELVKQVNSTSWCFCIRFLEEGDVKANWRSNKKDYKDLLDPDAFSRFS
jgi:hypothetical protein